MGNSITCPLIEFDRHLADGFDIFISSASFEHRCHSIINSFNLDIIKFGLVVCNTNNHYNHANFEVMVSRFEESGTPYRPVEIDSNDPIKTTDAFVLALSQLDSGTQRSVAIDITTFTRESLCILLRVIFAFLGDDTPIRYLYNPANGYGGSGRCWLSRGVSTVRSVIGYSGYIIPSRSNHLILLPGYEFERAAEIIANYEPNFLSLGKVPECENFSQDFYSRQREFVEQIIAFYSHGIVTTFDFSARDILATKSAVLKIADSKLGCNTIVIPLNAKPSVIGTSLACLANRRIQMGYAKPERYNTDDYSIPSENLTIMEISGY